MAINAATQEACTNLTASLDLSGDPINTKAFSGFTNLEDISRHLGLANSNDLDVLKDPSSFCPTTENTQAAVDPLGNQSAHIGMKQPRVAAAETWTQNEQRRPMIIQ